MIKNNAGRLENNKNDDSVQIEIFEGNFEHGGIRLIKTYLNDENKRVQKGVSTKCHVVELDEKVKTVFEEFILPPYK